MVDGIKDPHREANTIAVSSPAEKDVARESVDSGAAAVANDCVHRGDVPDAGSPLVDHPVFELPSNAPPALYAMLETPGGPRALAAAARSLLLNNPSTRCGANPTRPHGAS